ncbi:MAG: signal recognition particle subunit SRP19/SEC65 family protein [Promethearchaeota archaeon]
MRRKGLTIFYPQYFDSNRTTRLGRRVPSSEAVYRPTSTDLLEAAEKLKYYAEHETNAHYPRSPSDKPGRVLIDIMGQKKTFVLHRLAPQIKIVQDERKKAAQLAKRKKKTKTNKQILQEKLRQKQKAKKKK